jgi:hypothetical protein
MQLTDEAMCAAAKIMFGETWSFVEIEQLREALDAAIKTQGYANAHEAGVRSLADDIARIEATGRAEALEEAAAAIEPKDDRPCLCDYCTCQNIGSAASVATWDEAKANAAAIRALKTA